MLVPVQLPEVGEALTVDVAAQRRMASAEVLLEEFLVEALVFLHAVAAVPLLSSLDPVR